VDAGRAEFWVVAGMERTTRRPQMKIPRHPDGKREPGDDESGRPPQKTKTIFLYASIT